MMEKNMRKCPIVERFTDEFNHDAHLVEIGADWLKWYAEGSKCETAKLAAKALSAVAHRLRCFDRDFLKMAASRPICEGETEPKNVLDGFGVLLAERWTSDKPKREGRK